MSEGPTVSKRCACGWERPIISITTPSGKPPTEDLVPLYACPRCGRDYIAGEVPEDVAAAALRSARSRGAAH